MLQFASIFLQITTTPPPTAEQVSSGLVYVIAAYAVVWLVIFAYLYTIHRRQTQLKREIELLRDEELQAANKKSVAEVAPTEVKAGGRQEVG
jgi:CcmD family protein